MEKKHQFIISDECHYILAELQLPPQRNIIQGLQEEIKQIQFRIWSKSEIPSVLEILSPFSKIITYPRSTDVLTSITINSLSRFEKSGLFKTTEEISGLIKCLCECQYQLTSESACITLMVQIFSIFIDILNTSSHLIDCSFFELLFKFCEQDVRQLTQNGPHSIILTQVLSRIMYLILTRDDLKPLSSQSLSSLFHIADYVYYGNDWVSRNVSFKVLISIAEEYPTIPDQLITITCVLLHQQLNFQDTRENFVNSLRLFFVVFSTNWTHSVTPFTELFESILNFCSSNKVSQSLRSTAFNILIDFISQTNFVVTLYSNFIHNSYFSSLLEKFLNLVSTVAEIPSSLPESQSIALSLITTLISQLSLDTSNTRSYICENNPIINELNNQENSHEKFVKEFNENTSSFINSNIPSKEFAKMLFSERGISKDAIGKFFGHNKPYCNEVLQEYINLFDFSQLDIDQSIRLFLSSFRIPGEGQIVDRLLDMFSISFYNSHPNSNIFSDAASVHVFSVAWLMLHTSLHNNNVANKETFPGFLSMLKGQNNGKDYDAQFLSNIFDLVKRIPISLEKDTQSNSTSYWELLLQQDKVKDIKICDFNITEQPLIVIKLFKEIWQLAAPIFTVLFEHSIEGNLIVLESFSKCASIASYYRLHDILDNLIVNLCNLTHINPKIGFFDEKSKKVFSTLSLIIFDNGSQVQEGWKWFLELILQLFKMDILPEEMRTQNNICKENENVIIGPQMFKKSTRRNSSVLSFFRILGAYENEDENEGVPDELQINEQKTFLRECKIHQIIDNSLHFSSQSFGYFIKSLVIITQQFITNILDKPTEISICIHWITQSAIINSERIYQYWNIIYELYLNIFNSVQLNRTILLLLQRILNSMFNLMNHFWTQQKFRKELIDLLEKSTQFDQKIFESLLPELVHGLNSFFSLHISSFASFFKYKGALNILNLSYNYTEISTINLLNSLINKFLILPNQPGIDNLTDFWIPFLQTIVIYCLKNTNEEYYPIFANLQTLLRFQSIKNQTPQMWDQIFEWILFPAFSSLPSEIAIQRKKSPNIIERSVLMTKAIYKVFLTDYNFLSDLPNFERIWFRMIQYSLNLTRMKIRDFNELVPELLGNALFVLKQGGVFDTEERKQQWIDSCETIRPLLPKFDSLFNE